MKKVFIWTALSGISILILLPVLFSLICSFLPGYAAADLATNKTLGGILNIRPGFNQYYSVLIEQFWFYPGFWNSLFYAAAAATGAAVIAVPAGFALAKGNLRTKKAWLYLYTVLMLLPIQASILPNYIGLKEIGLLDTRLGIILPAMFSPFAVFLMVQYADAVSDDQIEAARLDTNSISIIICHIVLPQVRVCIGAVFLFVFAENWSLVEQPELLLMDRKLKPLSTMLIEQSEKQPEIIFAASILFIIPVLFLYLFFEQELSEGIAVMTVKI